MSNIQPLGQNPAHDEVANATNQPADIDLATNVVQPSQAAKAYDLGIYNRMLVGQLPENFQRELRLLTEGEHRTLLRCIWRFPLFGLPLELRELIYEAILKTAKDRLEPVDFGGKAFRGINILLTNKKVYAEAHPIMAKLNSVCLTFSHEFVPYMDPLRSFRWFPAMFALGKLIVHIVVKDVRLDTQSKDTREPHGVLSSLVEWLEDAASKGELQRPLDIKLEFSTQYRRLDDNTLKEFAAKFSKKAVAAVRFPRDEWKKPYLAGYLRLQLQNLVALHRTAMASLPGITFSTNVDAAIDNGITWKRLSHFRAVLKDDTNQQIGTIISSDDFGGTDEEPRFYPTDYDASVGIDEIRYAY